MADEPRVSVLTPVYNAEPYLAEAVESILAQTFRDFEFIIIDDGSLDGSLALLKRYAERDRRIRLLSRPNTGIVGALNEGLSLVRGELIARMDADDVALPDRLERQVAYLGEHPECSAVGSWVLAIDSVGDPLCVWCCAETHEAIDAVLLGTGQIPGLVHPATVFRHSAVLEAGEYRDLPGEDKDLFLRLAEHGQLANLPHVLLQYRLHPASLCHDAHRTHLSRSVRKILEQAYIRRGLDPTRIPVLDVPSHLETAQKHLSWGWMALMYGYRATALKHAWFQILQKPSRVNSWRLFCCAIRGR
jgi:glycosyltransferase involved in cell wall biosynthesis